MNVMGPVYRIALIFIFCLPLLPLRSEAGPIRLVYSISLPDEHEQTTVATDWAKELEKKSAGKLEIQVMPGSQILKPQDCYEGVVRGIVDIGLGAFAYTKKRFPVMSAVNLPMGYPDGKMASTVANQFAKFFQPKELDDVKLLYAQAPGPKYLHTKKPVKSLEDIRGMRIRAVGSLRSVASDLGAATVDMPYFEVYKALQCGVLDGVFGLKADLDIFNLAEVTSYTTDTTVVSDTSAMFVVMNKKAWETLPEDLQKLVEALSEEWVKKHGDAWDRADAEAWKRAVEKGRVMETLSDEESIRWRQAAIPTISNYIEFTNKRSGASCAAYYVNKIEDLLIKACRHCACPPGTYPCDNRCCKRIGN